MLFRSDAGQSLGDSIYEAKLYVLGKVESLGADCIEKTMTPHHVEKLERILARAGLKADARKFKRYGSARKLYNFHVDLINTDHLTELAGFLKSKSQ